jgi:23S rRNA (cytidine1920-2'-O)/16S rRNA (cytidine1409-2'-O)-methyltransferase
MAHRRGPRARLDIELVRRGLARSRDHAVELITEGRVRVAGQIAHKAATGVRLSDPIVVREDAGAATERFDYVSRGGHKLAGALKMFEGLIITGRYCLDAGASTGGFTDVLLRAGAAHVVAVDVGYGQLAWTLRNDPRVTVIERTNVRSLAPDRIGRRAEVVAADLSFISLALVLPALISCSQPDADYVLLVKPQFEVGRERVGAGGVVRDPVLRADAVRQVADRAEALGLGVRGVTASQLPGPSGNVEYFLWLKAGAPPVSDETLREAIENGPKGVTGAT